MKIINKKGMIPNMESYLFIICGRWDLNPHKRNAHKILSLARLPVPTLPLIAMKNLREAHHF